MEKIKMVDNSVVDKIMSLAGMIPGGMANGMAAKMGNGIGDWFRDDVASPLASPAPVINKANMFAPYKPETELGYTPISQPQVTPYKSVMNNSNWGGETKSTTFQPSEDKRLNNVFANIDTNKLANTLPSMEAPVVEEPPSFWGKTKDFFLTPTGRTLGAGLLTSGLVGLTGGNGLEALSYGAQSGGKASSVYRDQLNKEQKRKQEDNYFKSKLAEQQAEREARKQEFDQKISHDRDMADYKYNLELKSLGDKNEVDLLKEQTTARINAEKQYQLATSNLSGLENLVKENPDLVGVYAPANVGLSRLTGGEYGFNSQKMEKRGTIVRNLGSIRNDLIAQAKANGQSGINTAKEIEMATAGLNENSSSEEIIGALQYMKTAAQKVRDMSTEQYQGSVGGGNSSSEMQNMNNNVPQIGEIVDGYRYIGGNLNTANSWEKI